MKIESEKLLDRKLKEAVKKMGGMPIKLETNYISGLPDRLFLLPGGVMFFAEIKTTGEEPKPLQKSMHKKLKGLGFHVLTIDSSKMIDFVKEVYGK